MLRRGAIFALASAALFGASIPVAKRLVPHLDPLVLAALLYLGAGAALALLPGSRGEPGLRRGDAPLLAGIVICGGAAGPLLLVLGLARASGVTASLLLNLEAPFTALLAVALFREHVGARAVAGIALLVSAAAALPAWSDRGASTLAGAAFLAGACAAWAVDNNLTARLSLRDPRSIVRWKGLLGGGSMLLLALVLGRPLPGAKTAALALVVGALGYGVSLAWSVRAMRLIGAARQAALFAATPFAGALVSIPVLGERPGAWEALCALAMAAGLALLLSERHSHRHAHEPIEHEHLHVHDEHHRHAHAAGEAPEPHSHAHRHESTEHEHPHAPDAHHRHGH